MQKSKKTVVIGVSENPNRYATMATKMLMEYGHEVVPVGKAPGTINGLAIQTGLPPITEVDTITLYVNPIRQPPMYDYLIGLHPKRVIFNPGTENPQLITLLQQNGIETDEACTLVMLRTGQY
jgi:predicted CoA-binding protein